MLLSSVLDKTEEFHFRTLNLSPNFPARIILEREGSDRLVYTLYKRERARASIQVYIEMSIDYSSTTYLSFYIFVHFNTILI